MGRFAAFALVVGLFAAVVIATLGSPSVIAAK
jgi:hypothetical protein